jgi:hypothetical protein
MKRYHPLVLIALILFLASSAAGSGQASALPAQPELQTLPAWETHGAVQGEWLGIAVAGAGKVNGDVFSDVLVGANKGGANREGWAGLFLGSATGPQDAPIWQVFGENKGGEFGGAVDIAGDVNHDGYDDIVVGAANFTGEAPSDEAGEGAVYAYYGSDAGPGLTANWKIEGDLQGVRMGAAVAGGGYINGDEYADVIVGMPGFTNGDFENSGAAFVYFGSATGLNTAYGWLDYGGQSGAQFGLEVNAAGDVNGDGYGDVLVGEPYYNNDIYMDAGAVYLYLGNQFSLSNVPAWSYVGYRGGDRLGTTASGVGDLNGDGCDDIAIGAPGYNDGGMLDTGRVFVFYGCQNVSVSTLNSVADWEYSFPQANANTGIDVSSGGDTNNDGYAELLVGVHLFDDEQANEGAVMAFFGSAIGLSAEPGWRVEGNKNDTFFGFAVDTAGDTNHDGFADVLIGSPQFRYEELIKGAAFVYYGTPQITFYYHFMPFIQR